MTALFTWISRGSKKGNNSPNNKTLPRETLQVLDVYANVVFLVKISPEHIVFINYFCLKWLL